MTGTLSTLDNTFDPFDFIFAPLRVAQRAPKIAFAPQFKADVKDNGDSYTVTADFPGADKADIDVALDDDVLTISYEKKSEDEKGDKDEDGKWLTRERVSSYESVSRSFSLPDSDEESAEASLEDGVLIVNIQKKEKVDSTKKIEIK